MKNMVLLIDANVAIDYMLRREPNSEQAVAVMVACQKKECQGYIAFHSLPIMWYVLRKIPVRLRRSLFLELVTILTVANASHDAVVNALCSESFNDFEDCLQVKCAKTIHADYIVTENVKDFSSSDVVAVTPEELLNVLYKTFPNLNEK